MQRDATGQLVSIPGQQKTSVGRGVISGQSGEFLVETLKAQTEAEGLCVLEKKLAGLFNLCR
jgi:hypothetical protein